MENVKHPIATNPPALNVRAHDFEDTGCISPLQRTTDVGVSFSIDSSRNSSQGKGHRDELRTLWHCFLPPILEAFLCSLRAAFLSIFPLRFN